MFLLLCWGSFCPIVMLDVVILSFVNVMLTDTTSCCIDGFVWACKLIALGFRCHCDCAAVLTLLIGLYLLLYFPWLCWVTHHKLGIAVIVSYCPRYLRQVKLVSLSCLFRASVMLFSIVTIDMNKAVDPSLHSLAF